MNNKGFISTTVIYAFFVVFLMMLLMLVAKYSNNRITFSQEINNIKTSVLNSSSTPTVTVPPVVNSISFSDVTASSFKITINITEGSNPLKTYYYSRDNGATYQTSTSNTHIYTGLAANTTYNIKVYVLDNLSFESNIVSNDIKTSIQLIFVETLLANNGGVTVIKNKGIPNFSTNATTNEGMYAIADDYGTSYYFRGAVNNNWVKFADMYWRVVRVNGNNTVKLIYSGLIAPTEAQAVVMTGNGIQTETSAYNSSYERAEYVGYKYTIGQQRGLSTSSILKDRLENWYTTNLSSYDAKIADVIFCNDRSTIRGTKLVGTYSGNGVGTVGTYFGAVGRLIANGSSWAPIGTGPSLICPHKDDAFTKSDTTKGNGQLGQKVSLLTADEVSIAGGATSSSNSNSNYYLYTHSNYWLGSPAYFYAEAVIARQFYVNTSGTLHPDFTTTVFGVRPVISLLSNSSISSGNGTWNNPYVIN